MPQAILPLLTFITTAVGTGVSVGSAIYNDVNQPSQSQPSQPSPTTPAPVPTAQENIATETQNRMRQAMMARSQAPGLIDSTGGSLSPDAYNTLSSQLGGDFGSNPSTVNPGGYLGLGGIGSSAGGGTDLMSIIQQFQNGGSGVGLSAGGP